MNTALEALSLYKDAEMALIEKLPDIALEKMDLLAMFFPEKASEDRRKEILSKVEEGMREWKSRELQKTWDKPFPTIM